jgi:hypothetical protein
MTLPICSALTLLHRTTFSLFLVAFFNFFLAKQGYDVERSQQHRVRRRCTSLSCQKYAPCFRSTLDAKLVLFASSLLPSFSPRPLPSSSFDSSRLLPSHPCTRLQQPTTSSLPFVLKSEFEPPPFSPLTPHLSSSTMAGHDRMIHRKRQTLVVDGSTFFQADTNAASIRSSAASSRSAARAVATTTTVQTTAAVTTTAARAAATSMPFAYLKNASRSWLTLGFFFLPATTVPSTTAAVTTTTSRAASTRPNWRSATSAFPSPCCLHFDASFPDLELLASATCLFFISSARVHLPRFRCS